MERISVVLIDDNNEYRGALECFLMKNEVDVLGSYTQGQFMKNTSLEIVPNIAIISLDVPQFQTELIVAFMRKSFSSVKILINSIYDERHAVDKALQLDVDGLVFKIDKDPEGRIMDALEALRKNEKYFVTRS